MFGVVTSDDDQPVTWMGRYPIHVTTLLVMVHVACMILSCFLIAFVGGALLGLFAFDSAQVISNLHFWQIATYAFVHSPSGVIWFAIEMYMLFVFGREVERFLGRRAFIALYLLLLLVPTMLLTIWGLWHRTGLDGSATIHFAIFVAFAAIYPNVELFLRVMAKWVALIFVAAYSLQLLAYHGWSELAVLWISVGLAYGFVQLRGAGPELSLDDRLDHTLALEACAPRRPAAEGPPRGRPGEYPRLNRPVARKDLEVWHRQPDGERAARA